MEVVGLEKLLTLKQFLRVVFVYLLANCAAILDYAFAAQPINM